LALNLASLLAQLPPEQAAAVLCNPKEFAETFIRNPDGTPFTANDVQRRIFKSPYNKNVIRVHRRAGKSHSFAIIILYHALVRPNCKILVVGPMAVHVEEVFKKVRDFIEANDWIAPYKVVDSQSPKQKLEFSNGSRVTGLTTGVKSKGGALSARGQEADVVLIDEAAYLNESDWESLKAILSGDAYRSGKVLVYVASTPAFTRGTYYKLCKDPKRKDPTKGNYWHEIYQDLKSNPDPLCTPKYKQDCENECTTELEWTKEWMAEFPELGLGIFPKNLVEKCQISIIYAEHYERCANEDRTKRAASRTIGVDWDKLNRDGHGPNIAVLEAQTSGNYRVIYREEIPQSQFALHKAVARVQVLNEIFRPEWIYVDRGYGEYQVEEFQLAGQADPSSGLDTKVVGINFRNMIETPMPGGGPVDRKPFKHAMINLMRMWFERGRIEISKEDEEFFEQLLGYEVVTQTATTLTYSSENEHAIDAVGLAAMAMHHMVKNPYGFQQATQMHVVDAPQAVPGHLAKAVTQYGTARGLQSPRETTRQFFEHLGTDNSFSRSRLGMAPPVRRSSL
jgi:hypothetical protein